MDTSDTRFRGVEIGIKDIHENEIKEGDRIRVEHVNYMGTGNECVEESFEADVMYNAFQAMFVYISVGQDEYEERLYTFNHRSSRFEIVGS